MDEKMQRLTRYYRTCYPFERVFTLIPVDERREISFTLLNSTYVRYNTFPGYGALAQRVEKLCPLRFDIGAVYHDPPTKGSVNKPLMKELVFDVDLTDYTRGCCSTNTVCDTCFVIIKAAMGVLDFSLRTEFGFENVNFFFSGGRGLHCWVGDREAMLLGDGERRAVGNYFATVLSRQVYPGEYREILRAYSDEEGPALFEKFFVRLDSSVTSDTKHLLKAPFCIHPRTEKVCVALSTKTIGSLSLEDIPTLEDAIADPAVLDSFVKNISTK